jgi:hypothetical protein
MKFTIDNLDDIGPRDFTAMVDSEHPPQIVRSLNRPAEMTLALISEGSEFRMPVLGARVVLQREDGSAIFTGHLSALPEYERLGWGVRGDVYRHKLKAISEEFLLDRRVVRARATFVQKSAGEIVKTLAEDVSEGVFDTAGVQDVGTVARFRSTTASKWSQQVAELALRSRAAYRVHDRQVTLAPIGTVRHEIDEDDEDFSPQSLQIRRIGRTINDAIVVGRTEPYALVKDYFLGDGYELRFGLSQQPFLGMSSTLLEDEYKGTALRPEYWQVEADPGVVSVAGGKLRIAPVVGSAPTKITFVEEIEIAAAGMLQHGDVEFTAASDGIIGGLFTNEYAPALANCVAGFKATPSGAQSQLQAIINGVPTGAVQATIAGHKYVLSTRFYSDAVYRRRQTFFSSSTEIGGDDVGANVRLVLEVHEIDPASPGTIAAASRVLYDGVLPNAPGFCTYALVTGNSVHCDISYTRLRKIPTVQVRSALPSQTARTRLVGPSSEGGECSVSETALYFYSSEPPAPNEAIVANYWTGKRSMARLIDEASVDAEKKLHDDGLRSAALEVLIPEPRTSADCANAARALLSDSTGPAWAGEHEDWSNDDGQDVWPGDVVHVAAPSCGADLEATLREVRIEVHDLATDLAKVHLKFANDAAEPLAFVAQGAKATESIGLEAIPLTATTVVIADLPQAEVTAIASTAVNIDAGTEPLPGGGFEVRRSDLGWGVSIDRNLVGRYNTRTFMVPRLTRVQDYWIRKYDNKGNYSQHSALLHIDYPL